MSINPSLKPSPSSVEVLFAKRSRPVPIMLERADIFDLDVNRIANRELNHHSW